MANTELRMESRTDGAGRVWETDTVTGARYVYINPAVVVRTVDVGPGTFVDYAADGTIVGIEFI